MKGLRRLRGFVTSCRAALSSPRRTSWLSHRLLSSSHCAALLSSCHASWLSHCLSLSSRCATLSSSCFASFLSYCFSSSSCCSAHSSSRRVDWLLRRLLTRRPLVVSPSRRLVVSSSRRLVVLSSRRLVVSLSCRLVILSSRRAALSLYCHASWLSHHLSLSLIVPPSRPLIMPAGCCVASPCALLVLSLCASHHSPRHRLAVVHRRLHQKPLNATDITKHHRHRRH